MSDAPDHTFDVVIVGGGINGAGIAFEAAKAGLSVCLFEAGRFGHGTSSKSSMLAHGGVRYLEQFEFRLVHEALQDRERMLQEFPDLVKPLRFLYPLYPGIAARRTVRVGLFLYDLLSHGKTIPKRAWVKAGDVPKLAPGIETDQLKGAATYYDAQIIDVPALVARLIEQAREAGAVCLDDSPVESLSIEHDRCIGVRLADGQHVRARQTINAAGPWVDRLLQASGVERDGPDLLRRTKGSHIVVPRFVDIAIIIRAKDGRTFFVLPWNEHCLVGTTDTDFEGDPREAEATDEDIAYLIESARRYFPEAPLDEVRWAYAGVRPLMQEAGLTESNVTRRHAVFDHADEGIEGLWSLQGGKLTTYKTFGRQVVERLRRRLHAAT